MDYNSDIQNLKDHCSPWNCAQVSENSAQNFC